MAITEAQISETVELIGSKNRILLVSHRRPDGDTLGATVALFLVLAKLGKKPVAACIDQVPPRLAFLERLLPDSSSFCSRFSLADFDLIIISDAGASHMTGFHEVYPDFLSGKVPIINIDHHASNEGFGTINLIDTSASSATMVAWRLIKQLKGQMDKGIAVALLAGIYNDTGGLTHSNTTKETFEVAHELAAFGVSIGDIVRPMFKTSTVPQLKLWGYMLENLRRNSKGVVSTVVTGKEISQFGATSGDTGGIVDVLSTVKDARFTVMLAEQDGVIKCSLRTQRDDVDLNELASKFGGGGHPKASGFRVPGRLAKHIVWKILPITGGEREIEEMN